MNPYTGPQSHAAMDFFQSLLKGSGMPSGFASWMAPTLDPEELERKIVDLRVVLQWLEANARLTQATIQALEVQRMTLSTLKTMNVDMSDLAAHMGEAMRAGAQAMSAAAQPADAPRGPAAAAAPAPDETGADGGAAAETSSEGPRIPGLLDPMQWWSAVSEQFSKVAADALRESPWPIPPSSGPDASASARSQASSGDAPAAPPKRRSAARSGAGKPAAAAASGGARKRSTGGSRGSR
ncbi:MAG: hypothetical protein KGJ64_09440 [Betaproteobacteria bacterium]|nr:hypothetical protein [Betaproteobacteria bacterium]